ncbi:RHS repeat-associated core domain-containing protein, partial [Mesorhizobium retamae]
EIRTTSSYAYDNWGELWQTTNPDGTRSVVLNDPIGPRGGTGPSEESWLESAGPSPEITNHRRTFFNRFGAVERLERLDGDDVIATTSHLFDGLGRGVRKNEQFRGLEERNTGYTYDALGRVVSETLPDGSVVSRTFAEHVQDELPASMVVTPANTSRPAVTVGRQTFDGIGRMTKRSIGPRTEHYRYDEGDLRIKQRITPSGKAIGYGYVPALGDVRSAVETDEDAISYGYDVTSGQLLGAENAGGHRIYEYDTAGALITERWHDALGGYNREIHIRRTLNGRRLARQDIGGLETVHEYDAIGRPAKVSQGALEAEFSYDAFGRPKSVTTLDKATAQTLQAELEYDDPGREIKRTLRVGAHEVIIVQSWRADDLVAGRQVTRDGTVQLSEEFSYDMRGRLDMHSCTGPNRPKDRFGNVISRQVFVYDELDNIERCITTFADGSKDTARFTYAQDDPCQLVSITHDHANYPTLENFEYDADGNLLNDERGRRMVYNSLGQLLEVQLPAREGATRYSYDGHGELTGSTAAGQVKMGRIYDGFQLDRAIHGDRSTQFLYGLGMPLGHQVTDGTEPAVLLLADSGGSVLAESTAEGLSSTAYTAYGECSGPTLQGMLAFNGEARDEITGWYLLGNGYRAYNPVLMRFHSPDNLGPFAGAGINPYMYCLGNPVNFRDPSGHRSTRRDPPPYVPPYEAPKPSFWQKWSGVIMGGIGLLASALFLPLGGIGMAVGLVGLVVQGAGLGMQVAGTLNGDSDLALAGMITGAVGGLLSLGAGLSAPKGGTFGKWAYSRGARALGRGGAVGSASRSSLGAGSADWGGYNVPRRTAYGSVTPGVRSRASSFSSVASNGSTESPVPTNPLGSRATADLSVSGVAQAGPSGSDVRTSEPMLGSSRVQQQRSDLVGKPQMQDFAGDVVVFQLSKGPRPPQHSRP